MRERAGSPFAPRSRAIHDQRRLPAMIATSRSARSMTEVESLACFGLVHGRLQSFSLLPDSLANRSSAVSGGRVRGGGFDNGRDDRQARQKAGRASALDLVCRSPTR